MALKPRFSPEIVAARLEVLRRISVIERDDEARSRLARERPRTHESFERAVERRLGELRALCELARYVQRGQ
jgi:hypothetical protein